jgi:hypothetical protein
MLNYYDTQQVILRLAPEAAGLFADRWERFPGVDYAKVINEELRMQHKFWDAPDRVNKDNAVLLSSAIESINYHATL